MEEQDNIVFPGDDEGEPIPVKVRENIRASIARAAQEKQQFEQASAKFQEASAADNEPILRNSKAKFQFAIPPQHRRSLRPNPENVTEEERTWAAIAHSSALLTIAVAVSTVGIGALFTVFVPLGIYFYYQNRSEYIAHHAMQAFGAQVVGTIGFAILLTTAVTVWGILLAIFAVLSLIVIGIPFLLATLFLGLIVIGATFLLPLAMLVYGMIGAVEAWNGHYYSYPWVGDWVDDQIYSRGGTVI